MRRFGAQAHEMPALHETVAAPQRDRVSAAAAASVREPAADQARSTPRWLRRLLFAAAGLALLLFAAWIAVPPLARWQLESRLTEALGRTTTVEAVEFNPFKLRLTVRNLAIADTQGRAPLLAFDELVADVSTASIWHRAPVLDALRIVRPRASLSRDARGRYNVQDLVERPQAEPAGEAPGFSLNNIEVEDGAIAFADGVTGRQHALTALDVAIPFLSSLSYQTDVTVTPRASGAFNGSPFALAGTTRPFAEHREATLGIDLDGVRLPDYVAYLPAPPRHALAGGTLSTRLTLAFVDGGATRRLELRGTARLDGLDVRRRDGTTLAAAERIDVAIERLGVFDRELALSSVAIHAPRIDVRRFADGSIEIAQPPFESRTAAPAAPDAKTLPWTASLAKLSIANGSLSLADDTSGFRSTLSDVAIDVSNLTTRTGDKAQVKLAFVSSDRIASFTGEAEVEPLAPAATGRFDLSKFSLSLLFPYYRDVLAVEVRKGSLDLGSRFALAADGRVTLADGTATISGLELAMPGQRNPLWRIPSLAATGVDVDVAARTATLASVHAPGPVLRLVRERDGSLEIERFLKPPPAAGAPDGKGGWTVAAKKTVVERASIDVEDREPEPPVKLAIRDLAATATDLSNARGARAGVSLRARVGERGRIAFNGPVTAQPLALAGTVDASALALLPLKPYVEPRVNVVVTDGALFAKGRIAVDTPAGAPVRATWKGRVEVASFAALDKPTLSDLARWKSLVLEDLDVATSPLRVATSRIAFEDFYARVIVYPDATLNLARLLTPGEAPEPAAGAQPAARNEAATPRGALPLTVGRIDVARGNVNFTDLFVRPNYSANLTDVAGSISTLSAEQSGDVALTARVDGTAPVDVSGRLNPFASELSLDLTGKARDVDLPPLTPYAVKYAGYGIEKGKLAFDVHYRIENRKLAAENRLVLDQLTFGERVESPTATKLPVLLAVALLKDSRGVIDIQLPISGSLDDPKFSVGGLIVRVIVNLITKAVTAPFALLSSLFGGGEELSTLAFAPGSAAIKDDMQKRVDTLGKALTDRPGLKLDIAGRADPDADRAALRRDAVENALRREKMKTLARNGASPASLDQVTIAADERERWLAAAYRESPIEERPRNVLGMLKDVPAADMEAMLLANTDVDDDALRRLATRRAQAVKDGLEAKGVNGERLFVVAPRLGNEAATTKATAEATAGGASRVDLALR